MFLVYLVIYIWSIDMWVIHTLIEDLYFSLNQRIRLFLLESLPISFLLANVRLPVGYSIHRLTQTLYAKVLLISWKFPIFKCTFEVSSQTNLLRSNLKHKLKIILSVQQVIYLWISIINNLLILSSSLLRHSLNVTSNYINI